MVEKPLTDRERIFGKLNQYRQRPNNWDGRGSWSCDKQTLRAVEDFVKKIPNGFLCSDVTVDSEGDIRLEWWADSYLRLEFRPWGEVVFYAHFDPSDETTGKSGSLTWEESDDLLSLIQEAHTYAS